MKRKAEFFGPPRDITCQHVVSTCIRKCFPQERDWTCSVACIRSMLSAFQKVPPTEDEIIEQGGLEPGPHFSEELNALPVLEHYCVRRQGSFDEVLVLLDTGWSVMLESMYNYGHWMVLLGYYPASSGSNEDAHLLLYDPYYDCTRLVCLDEFLSMWRDGDAADNDVVNDFLAICPKKRVCALQGSFSEMDVPDTELLERFKRVKRGLLGGG